MEWTGNEREEVGITRKVGGSGKCVRMAVNKYRDLGCSGGTPEPRPWGWGRAGLGAILRDDSVLIAEDPKDPVRQLGPP